MGELGTEITPEEAAVTVDDDNAATEADGTQTESDLIDEYTQDHSDIADYLEHAREMQDDHVRSMEFHSGPYIQPPVNPVMAAFNPKDMGWLGVALLGVGMLGGRIARQGMPMALESMTAAMKGFHDGRIEAVKQDLARFNAESTNALRQTQIDTAQAKQMFYNKKGAMMENLESAKLYLRSKGYPVDHIRTFDQLIDYLNKLDTAVATAAKTGKGIKEKVDATDGGETRIKVAEKKAAADLAKAELTSRKASYRQDMTIYSDPRKTKPAARPALVASWEAVFNNLAKTKPEIASEYLNAHPPLAALLASREQASKAAPQTGAPAKPKPVF